MNDDKSLRDHLLKLLGGGQAHCRFEEAVADMPAALQGKTVKGMPHSAWQLLEHLRLAQWDILDFSQNPDYQHKKWPDEYWPGKPEPPSPTSWDESVKAFHKDQKAMGKLVKTGDLFARIPWGDGQTLLREAMLVADHNAYHLGQLVTLRRILGAWKD